MLKSIKTIFLAEKEFWYIIGLLDWKFVGDDDRVIRHAIDYLSSRSILDIELFYKTLKDKLGVLDHLLKYKEVSSKDKAIMELMNKPEAYLYTRYAVIANGKKYFEAVLENPIKIKENTTFFGLEQLCKIALKKNELI